MKNRREIIKGLSLGVSAPAFLPFLQNLQAEVAGDEARLPKRFVFVVKSSGMDPQNFVPTDLARNFRDQREKLVTRRVDEKSLSETLRPLAKFRGRMSVIHGLSGNNFRGNHTLGLGLLSCVRSEKVAMVPTLDYCLGERFSTGPYPMYGMAVNSIVLSKDATPEDGFCYPNLSAKGKGKPVPFQASPDQAFYELFGSAVLPKKEARRRLSVHKNLMDFLGDEAKAIERRLSPEDRSRFANYKESFESLRVQKERQSLLSDEIEENAPEFGNKYQSRIETERQECQFEMAGAALITGLTNVVTLRPDTLGTVYTGLGFDSHQHAIGHGGEAAEGIDSWTGRRMIENHHVSMIAKLAEKLDSVPEGNGTMLDNTLIVYTSCAGNGHHNGWTDFPFLMVGNTGQKLTMGKYLLYPSYQNKGHKTLANLYLSILQASGMETGDTYGQLDPQLKDLDTSGPLSELA